MKTSGRFKPAKKTGKVFLVGYGPGAPDLMTLRAEKILSSAEIVFYDDLVDGKFLKRFRCEKIYVGKRAGRPGLPQSEINRLLHEAASAGRRVVRLKGGDPFVFGRGGEELAYLAHRNIPVEVVPGVTAALAAAACSKTPLTQRGISSSVAFCVGHPEDKIRVPEAETVVYYMAGANAGPIARKMISAGWPPDTPAVLVRNASLPGEQVTVSTLGKELKRGRRYPSPVVLIVGRTGSAKDRLISLSRPCCVGRREISGRQEAGRVKQCLLTRRKAKEGCSPSFGMPKKYG